MQLELSALGANNLNFKGYHPAPVEISRVSIIIIVTGLPGTGKSTVLKALNLKETYPDIQVVDRDLPRYSGCRLWARNGCSSSVTRNF